MAALGAMPIAPPEHAHEAEEQGHHHVVVHRHTEPHEARPLHHHDSVTDPDEPILTVAAVYTVPAWPSVETPMLAVDSPIESPKPVRINWPVPDVDTPIHSPPRAPTSLRAPPISPAR